MSTNPNYLQSFTFCWSNLNSIINMNETNSEKKWRKIDVYDSLLITSNEQWTEQPPTHRKPIKYPKITANEKWQLALCLITTRNEMSTQIFLEGRLHQHDCRNMWFHCNTYVYHIKEHNTIANSKQTDLLERFHKFQQRSFVNRTLCVFLNCYNSQDTQEITSPIDVMRQIFTASRWDRFPLKMWSAWHE